jgi:hypothetical protein
MNYNRDEERRLLVKSWQGVYNSARFRHKPDNPVTLENSCKSEGNPLLLMVLKSGLDFTRNHHNNGVRGAQGR